MKYFVASDIHGSAFYCRRMLEAYDREQADKLVILGDILYHGPRNNLPEGYAPKEVIELLNERREDILCVRGNCDAQVDQMVLQFPIMADYSILVNGEDVIYATHGHVFNEKNLPPMAEGNILLHGHTHVPKHVIHRKYVYMNPGSVSIPKENSHHGYMIMEQGSYVWKDLEGTVIDIKKEYCE